MAEAIFLARQLAVAAVLASTLVVAGKIVLGRTALRSLAEELSTAMALGLGLVGTVLFVLSALRLFDARVLALVLVAVHAAGWRVWRDLVRRARAGPPARRLALLLPLALVGVPAFALTLYPPTAFDETLYHLVYARAFAANQGLPFLETLRFPVAPQLVEALCGALLRVAGDVSTHVPSALALGATALALFAWVGGRSTPASGAAAAAIWLGHPLTAWLAGTAYVDLPVALFGVLAWTWWDRWRTEGATSSLTLAGAFTGFAAATKYNGLVIVALLGAATAVVALRRREWASLAKFAGIAVLVLAPWYGRNLAQTGNPVFPLLPDVFGPNAWMTPDDRSIWESGPRDIPASVAGYAASRARETVLHPQRLLQWPLQAAYEPSAFGGQPTLSPWLPLLIVLAFLGAILDRAMRPAMVFAAALFAATTAHDPRLLLPAVALLGGAAAVGAARSLERLGILRLRAAAPILAIVLAGPGALYVAWKVARQGPPPARPAEREAYLSRSLRGYPLLALLNRTKGSSYTVYALFLENLAYHCEGRFLGDWVGPYRYPRVVRALGSATALREELDAMKVDYLLVNVPRLPRPLPTDASFGLAFRSVAAAGPVLLLERVGPVRSSPGAERERVP